MRKRCILRIMQLMTTIIANNDTYNMYCNNFNSKPLLPKFFNCKNCNNQLIFIRIAHIRHSLLTEVPNTVHIKFQQNRITD